ncbi:ATP-dependent metallopeptidase FtsH/Yme1/Tma family protein [Candidatus Uhrbacteria bacterium]|nr:ATP-dependent metallopeptidase FtsH/Yme1/Tma family protein [Candidatus Uhrbacteria bacterium]
MKRILKVLAVMGGIFLVLLWSSQNVIEIPYSEALAHIEAGQIESVLITDGAISLTPNAIYFHEHSGEPFTWKAGRAGELQYLEMILLEYQVRYDSKSKGWFARNWIWIILIPLWILFLVGPPSSKRGGLSGIFNFTQHKGKRAQNVSTSFADVAGYEQVKTQLQEVVAFLKDPSQFSRLGAKLPTGVLLFGPPGTGKTLIARATAGEAGVPFIHISGSDFVEMFVGVGAGRVTSLFEEARKSAPCIIFIDEIDAVGQHRSNGGGGGDSERDQTINKLLAEMDGFEETTGIIVIAATNRAELLDEALQRRFGRKVYMGLPSVSARKKILEVHARGKLVNGINYQHVASLTPGMSGAGLAGIFNEAALLATREGADCITTDHLVRAIELVVVGHKDLARRLSDGDRATVAVHESGHAVVRSALGGHKRVTRVSIIPTSLGALGYNLNTPEDEADALLRDSGELLADVMCLLGGRAAEQVINGKISTGASDDLRRANRILFEYVTLYGFSDKLAHRCLREGETHWSEHTAHLVDTQIESLLAQCYTRAQKIIETNRGLVGRLTADLLVHEELSGEALQGILRQTSSETTEV